MNKPSITIVSNQKYNLQTKLLEYNLIDYYLGKYYLNTPLLFGEESSTFSPEWEREIEFPEEDDKTVILHFPKEVDHHILIRLSERIPDACLEFYMNANLQNTMQHFFLRDGQLCNAQGKLLCEVLFHVNKNSVFPSKRNEGQCKVTIPFKETLKKEEAFGRIRVREEDIYPENGLEKDDYVCVGLDKDSYEIKNADGTFQEISTADLRYAYDKARRYFGKTHNKNTPAYLEEEERTADGLELD